MGNFLQLFFEPAFWIGAGATLLLLLLLGLAFLILLGRADELEARDKRAPWPKHPDPDGFAQRIGEQS
jgi:hypothetical protein